MLFDSHAHLNDEAFDQDRAELLETFKDAGVGLVMNAGCSLESSREGIALAEAYPWIYCSVGTHPDTADEVNEEVLEVYRQMCKHPKVKAIGEIGLDYYYETIHRDAQMRAFRIQMQLAEELDMPVIVHERDAHDDGMSIVKEFPNVKGVFHCYSGSVELAKELVKLGWMISFTGVLTYKNARKAVEVAEAIPMEHLMIETDSPYMAPVPHRGKRNDSGYVLHICEKLAEIKGISTEECARITLENGKRFFGIE